MTFKNNFSEYHIHGDNIVECERALDLIIKSFGNDFISISRPATSIVCPQFVIKLKGNIELLFIFYPGFGRWDKDILEFVKYHPEALREAADVIITGVNSEK